MWDESINEIAEKDPNDDDVLYLKSDFVCEDDDTTADKPLDTTYVCWSKTYTSELVSLAVHPAFPAVAHVAVGSCDDTCKVINFAATDGNNGANETILGPFEETVSCCSYSPNGAYLTLGLMDGNFMVYASNKGEYECISTVNGPAEGVEWISWNKDSQHVMFGGSGHTVFIWDCQTQTASCISTTDTSTCGQFCTYSGSDIAVLGCNDGHLNIGRYENGVIGNVNDVVLGSEMVTCLDCHDKVQLAAAGLYDGRIFLVELSRFHLVASFTEHEDTVEAVQFCKGAPFVMAVSCGHDGKVITWDCDRMVKLNVAMLSESLTRMVWIACKNMVAIGSASGELYTVKNGILLRKNRPHKLAVLDLAILPCEGKEVALISASEDGTMAM
ncbi:mitochondrial division protein 1-related protein [Babesia gibsoni]|uniref:Mitochondrial division protein 1-related protein n=1 Tax=Babesia gibsoni TaxID=33632 RepID=A0AAD8LK51_BABGI|nr:mitochondrial division protein 1-related protein [Babesia gibsoni]